MRIGICRFLPWENGIQATETGNRKNGKSQKWEWDLSMHLDMGFRKKNYMGNGIGNPLQYPLITNI